jgi:hypothetical protein
LHFAVRVVDEMIIKGKLHSMMRDRQVGRVYGRREQIPAHIR